MAERYYAIDGKLYPSVSTVARAAQGRTRRALEGHASALRHSTWCNDWMRATGHSWCGKGNPERTPNADLFCADWAL